VYKPLTNLFVIPLFYHVYAATAVDLRSRAAASVSGQLRNAYDDQEMPH
jgi:hypothetical protein